MDKYKSKYLNTALCMDEALLILLENKEYEYITVKEICQKAGVNRSTFYLHYETIDDLLKETIEMVNERFYNSFGPVKDSFKGNWKVSSKKEELVLITPKYLSPYLNFIKDNKKLFKLMYSRPILFNCEKVFRKMCDDIFDPILTIFSVEDDEKEYTMQYYIKGILAVIMEWVNKGCQDDFEKITNIIIKCTLTKTKK